MLLYWRTLLPCVTKACTLRNEILFDFDLIVQSDIPCGKARLEFDLIWSHKASFFFYFVV